MRTFLLLLLLCGFGCGGAAKVTTHDIADDLTVHQLELSVSNVYVVEGPDGAVIVDAGDPKQADEILAGIDEAGVDRDRIGAIIITHAHADHTGSAKALSEALGVPNARAGRERLRALLEALKLRSDPSPWVRDAVLEHIARDKKRDGDDILFAVPGEPGDVRLERLSMDFIKSAWKRR